MNRRGFIAALAAFASTAVLDPERALWARGAKTISIPQHRPVVRVFEFYGQSVFPVLKADGYLSGETLAYPEDAFDWNTGIFDQNRKIVVADAAAFFRDNRVIGIPHPRHAVRGYTPLAGLQEYQGQRPARIPVMPLVGAGGKIQHGARE